MKHLDMSSSFFICMVFLLYGLSSYAQIEKIEGNHIDSSLTTDQYFNLSKNKKLPIKERLSYIDIFLENVKDVDSLIYKGWMRKTVLLSNGKQYDKAYYFSQRLLDLATKNGDTLYIAKALNKLALYSRLQDQLDISFKYYNEGFTIFKKIGDSASAGKNLLSMSNIQKSTGDFIGSKITAIDGLKLIENSEDLKTISGFYQVISTAYREEQDLKNSLIFNDSALINGKKAVALKKIKEIDFLKIKNTRANIYADLKKYPKAISILNTLLKDSILTKEPKEFARVIDNLGFIQWQENKTNSQSKPLLQEALKIRKEENDTSGLIASNIHLARYYFDNNKSKALHYAKRAYFHAQNKNSLLAIKESLGLIFDLEKKVTFEAKAYKTVDDKIRRINQTNRGIYDATKYANDRLLADNQAKEKQVLQQQNALLKSKNKNNMLLGIISLTLLGLFFLYYYLRQRTKRLKEEKKTETLEAIYNTEAALSRKLHDDFGGKLNHAMLLLQAKTGTTEVLNIVDGLYNQSRDFSREINDVDTGSNFKDFLFAMMGNYAKNQKLIVTGSTDVDWSKISSLSKKTLFKVLQELLINMQKHSKANLVTVSFRKSKKLLKVTYADNGVGASDEELHFKNGLWNTEKRIEAIGGTIIFDSEKGHGFQAQIGIPN